MIDLLVALLLALVALAALFLSPVCGRLDPCGNELVSEALSPSGRLRAVVFLRDCGATTAYGVELSILRAEAGLPNRAGNAFSADAGHTDVPLKLDVRWDTDEAVTVRYDPRLRVFTNEARVGRVQVRYVQDEGAP